jgi:hypothetical protein
LIDILGKLACIVFFIHYDAARERSQVSIGGKSGASEFSDNPITLVANKEES